MTPRHERDRYSEIRTDLKFLGKMGRLSPPDGYVFGKPEAGFKMYSYMYVRSLLDQLATCRFCL